MTDVATYDAYILKANRLSDSRWQLALLTEAKGRLQVWYRKGRQGILPSIFVPYWLETKRANVVRMEYHKPVLPLEGEALLSAWYLNELIIQLVREEEACPKPYHIYQATIQALRETKSREALEYVLRRFEWQLLEALGYGIALTHDANGVPLSPEKQYQCIPEQGLVPSAKGVKGQIYLALAEEDWQSPILYSAAKQLMRTLLHAALEGRTLKSRALFRSV